MSNQEPWTGSTPQEGPGQEPLGSSGGSSAAGGRPRPYTVNDSVYGSGGWDAHDASRWDQQGSSGATAYTTPPAYGQQGGYDQPPYGQQSPYAQQYPYGQQTLQGSTGPYGQGTPFPYRQAARPMPPTMGRIGAIAVFVLTAVNLWCCYALGKVLGQLVTITGMGSQVDTQVDTSTLQQEHPELYHRMVTASSIWCAVGLAGLVAWIVCIVAAARRSARPLAIAGIVVGVAAVICGWAMVGVGMLPYIPRS